MGVVSAFAALGEVLEITRVVAWDVDATLGETEGWTDGSLRAYCYKPDELTELLKWLKSEHGVVNLVVSRNSGFCDADLAGSTLEALALGFDGVVDCPRRPGNRERSKVALVVEHAGCAPYEVLLIDDQPAECRRSAADGGVAVCNDQGPALKVVPLATFHMYAPGEAAGEALKIVL